MDKDTLTAHPAILPPEDEFDLAGYKEFLKSFERNFHEYNRLYDLHLQYEPKERRDAPERQMMASLREEWRLLTQEYLRRLPIRPIARCPYCGSAVLRPVDIFSLMAFHPLVNIGNLYNMIRGYADRSLWKRWPHCEHFIVTTFSVNLHHRLPNDLPAWTLSRTWNSLHSAPGVMIWPLIARQTGAVIHSLPIGRLDDSRPTQRYTIYFISYFGGPDTNLRTKAMWVPTDLGGPATGGVYYDFDLMKWVKAGRLLWLDPRNPQQLLSKPARAFPYANVQPQGWYEIMEGGRVNGPKPFTRIWKGAAIPPDQSYSQTIE